MTKYFSLGIVAGLLLTVSCTQPHKALYRSDAEPSKQGDTLVFSMTTPQLAKGSQVDFMASVAAADSTTSPRWAVEFFDGNRWIRSFESVHVMPKAEGHNSIVFRTFITKRQLDSVQVRMLPLPVDTAGSDQSLLQDQELLPARDRHVDQRLVAYQGYNLRYPRTSRGKSAQVNVGLIGNSFTYYYGAGFMLKEIARCQGLHLNIHASLKGGQYFRQHVGLELTREMLAVGNYDFVFLQDQSQQSARHFEWLCSLDGDAHLSGTDGVAMSDKVVPETKALGDAVLEHSPDAKLVVEATWAYEGVNNWQGYGSFEAFDNAMQKGGEDIAATLGYICSPIGRGFELARAEGINLYWQDNKHQNVNGSYLKACINYLIIARELGLPVEFNADVPDCGIPSDTAQTLRRIALSLIAE